MADDATLLRRFAQERVESAFSELVWRHIGMVFATALRRVGGYAHQNQPSLTAPRELPNRTIAVDRLVFADSDDASLRVNLASAENRSRTAKFQLRRMGDGWRLRVPAKVIEGYRALVMGHWEGNERGEVERNAAAVMMAPTIAIPAPTQ